MHRRHFVKLSATAAAALLFSRITSAEGVNSLIATPGEVWAQLGKEWIRLNHAGNSLFTYKDVEVSIKPNSNAMAVYIQSPSVALSGVRLKWKHGISTASKVLGDNWERTYGDTAWKTPAAGIKNPWYMLLHDGKETACFGVKTGCNAICSWTVNTDNIKNLTLRYTFCRCGRNIRHPQTSRRRHYYHQGTAAETPL